MYKRLFFFFFFFFVTRLAIKIERVFPSFLYPPAFWVPPTMLVNFSHRNSFRSNHLIIIFKTKFEFLNSLKVRILLVSQEDVVLNLVRHLWLMNDDVIDRILLQRWQTSMTHSIVFFKSKVDRRLERNEYKIFKHVNTKEKYDETRRRCLKSKCCWR